MPNHIRNLLKLECSKGKLKKIYQELECSEENDRKGFDFGKIIPMPETLNIECGSSTNRAVELYMTSINPEVTYYGSGYKMEGPAFEALRKALERQMYGKCDASLTPEKIAEYTEHTSAEDMLKLGEQAVTNLIRYHAMTWYEWSINNWGTKWNSYSNSFDGKTIAFDTAWSAPHPVILKLSEMYPDIQIEHQWADEDIGHNCGRRDYKGGEIVGEYIPESNKDSLDFACEVWGSEVGDYGLVLNADESDYIRPDEDKYDLITFRGQPALFVNDRMTKADIPKGLYCYHVRMDDNGKEYATIEPKVFVNLGASVITSSPIDFRGNDHIPLQSGDFDFLGDHLTLDQFLDAQYDIDGGQTLG